MERLIRLAIIDSDSEYVNRLATGIAENSDFEISTYTDIEIFLQTVPSKSYDIVLYNSSLTLNKVDDNGTLYIPLTEEVSAVEIGIYKYDRTSNIYKEILGVYSEVKSAKLSDEKAHSIVVYSPIGGCGKTITASVLANKLSMNGYRVLYQNLECLSSANDFFNDVPGEKGISELLEFIDSDIDFSAKVKSLLKEKNGNLYYLNSFITPSDLIDMRESDIDRLTDILASTGLFDYIVYDTDSALSMNNIKLMEKADTILIIGRGNEFGKRKLELFYSLSHIVSRLSFKMLHINNFSNGEIEDNIPVPQIGSIGTYQNMSDTKLIEQLSKTSNTDFLINLK